MPLEHPSAIAASARVWLASSRAHRSCAAPRPRGPYRPRSRVGSTGGLYFAMAPVRHAERR